MWLFRKPINLSRSSARPVCADDLTRVSRMLRDGAYRYYGLTGEDVAVLVEAGSGAVLTVADEIIGVALVSMPVGEQCWLRGLVLAEGVDLYPGVTALLAFLHTYLQQRGLVHIYYAGDETADVWLIPVLQDQGYSHNTEVVVYEKRDLVIPEWGNAAITIRPAIATDLGEVLRLDRACFEPQWTKDNLILEPAIHQGPFFVIAELDGAIVGYAYATSHFGWRLIHLVRIAVDPASQGKRIGIRLLAAVTDFAATHGASFITLNTQAYNTHAQRIYRWFGFEPNGERQIVLRYQLDRNTPGGCAE